MDLWLHAQISDMIHQKVIMADIVWPIFKWPLNNHGHGLLENNPGRPIFELLRASSVYLEPFLYFVPGMKWLHAVAVGWMYLIGVAEVLGGVDTGPCCQKDSLYRPVPCLSIQIPERQCTAMYCVDTVKKAHNTQNLLCHWPRTLSKRFSICCDWPGRDYNTRFYATRSISWCFYRPTNHVQSTSKKHLCNMIVIKCESREVMGQSWVNWP